MDWARFNDGPGGAVMKRKTFEGLLSISCRLLWNTNLVEIELSSL